MAAEVFTVFGFGVDSTMLTMTGITAALGGVSYAASRKMKAVPGRFQSAMELLVEALRNFLGDVLGGDNARRYLPLLGTMFLFILVANFSGLVPGIKPPTATLSVTAGLAIIIFLSVNIFGIKQKGLGYFKHFISPFAFLLPLIIIEEIVRPVSLSLRLYGNIFGEKTVVTEITNLIPLIAPLPFFFLGILLGFLQALVFTMLSSIYISGAIGDGH